MDNLFENEYTMETKYFKDDFMKFIEGKIKK